ncbi:MAG: hypothetical protein J6V72_14575 [Kiritimatiellae bacterium]|nr:hypothetical protein [Kiritimatiellia bacterium]
MKRLALIAGLAVMASFPAFAKSSLPDTHNPRLDELFGYKFGDRMPENAPVSPSGDGTLLATIKPKHPEFPFQQYFAYLLPQTHVIVGFAAADTFQDDEFTQCHAAYARCKKAIETRFGKKMKSFPPPQDGLADQQVDLLRCNVEFADKKVMVLHVFKNNPGGYNLRLIALDKEAIQESMEGMKQIVDSPPAPEGLFGQKLAVRAPVSADEMVLAGICVQSFEPEKKFLDFDVYLLQILPRSRKIFRIMAGKEFEDRFSAIECHAKVCRLLEKKFGQKMTDVTSNFDSTKPDAGGQQVIKCAVIAFSNPKREIMARCFWNVDDDDKIFRVQVVASDILLVNALESEIKSANKDSDAGAIDAL